MAPTQICPPAINPATIKFCLVLTDVVVGGLWLTIVVLSGVAIVIVAGRWPRISATRIIALPETHGADWSCVLQLSSPTVFAVQQPITVDITLDPGSQSVSNPTVTFHGVAAEDTEIALARDDEAEVWHGSGELTFHRPGKPKFKYEFGFRTDHKSVGEIAPLNEYYQQSTSRFVLVFSVVTAILAAASLIVSLTR